MDSTRSKQLRRGGGRIGLSSDDSIECLQHVSQGNRRHTRLTRHEDVAQRRHRTSIDGSRPESVMSFSRTCTFCIRFLRGPEEADQLFSEGLRFASTVASCRLVTWCLNRPKLA